MEARYNNRWRLDGAIPYRIHSLREIEGSEFGCKAAAKRATCGGDRSQASSINARFSKAIQAQPCEKSSRPLVKSRAVRCNQSSKHRRHSGLPLEACERKSSIPHSASSASRIGYDDWSGAQTNSRSPRFALSSSPRALMPAPTNPSFTHAGAVGFTSDRSLPPAKHPCRLGQLLNFNSAKRTEASGRPKLGPLAVHLRAQCMAASGPCAGQLAYAFFLLVAVLR